MFIVIFLLFLKLLNINVRDLICQCQLAKNKSTVMEGDQYINLNVTRPSLVTRLINYQPSFQISFENSLKHYKFTITVP